MVTAVKKRKDFPFVKETVRKASSTAHGPRSIGAAAQYMCDKFSVPGV